MNNNFKIKFTGMTLLIMGSVSIYANEASHLRKETQPTMVTIPAGAFTMGCQQEAPCPPEEQPLTPTSVASFQISKYEITFSQWDQCYNEGACNHYPQDNGWGRGNRPVINVNWYDTQQFTTWLSNKTGANFRLPTEAEWEYAARARTTSATPYGNCIQPHLANFDSRFGDTTLGCSYKLDYKGQTMPVGSYPANLFGLNDMIGNITEWTLSCATKDYSQSSDTKNCKQRVTRGSSWDSLRWEARSAARINTIAHERNNTTGFRVVQPL